MTPPKEDLPDDKKWLFPEIDGVKTGWANLPPGEVLAIVNMVQYLAEQLRACDAITNAQGERPHD